MKVINVQTGKEHNIDQKTFDAWTSAGILVKVLEVQKPTAIKEKELKPEAVKVDE